MYFIVLVALFFFFFFQAEDGIRDLYVTGVQTCALPISGPVDMGFLEDAVCTDHHLDDNGKTVLIEIQGGKISRNFFREHGEYLSCGINRGGVMARMLVKC